MRKEVKVFTILGCIFVANVILAEFIGVKIFALDTSLGFQKLEYSLLGQPMSMQYTAGVLIWPVVFILTDIINDYFGKSGVKFLTYTAVGVSIYAFLIIKTAIHLDPADWWQYLNQKNGISDFNIAYKLILGQGNNIIIGSLTAFVIGQLIDIHIFQRLKKTQLGSKLWIRATLSTLVSQLIDSFVVIYIAFYLGQNWPLNQVFSVSLNNYVYKGVIAILMIPFLHVVHKLIENYLGEKKAHIMRENALKNKLDF